MRVRKRRKMYEVVKHGRVLLRCPTKTGAKAFVATRKETKRTKRGK